MDEHIDSQEPLKVYQEFQTSHVGVGSSESYFGKGAERQRCRIPPGLDSPCALDACTVYGLKEADAKRTLPFGISRTLKSSMVPRQAPQYPYVEEIEAEHQRYGLTIPISKVGVCSCGFLALPRLCTKSRSFIGFLGIKIGLSGLEKAFKMRLKRSY